MGRLERHGLQRGEVGVPDGRAGRGLSGPGTPQVDGQVVEGGEDRSLPFVQPCDLDAGPAGRPHRLADGGGRGGQSVRRHDPASDRRRPSHTGGRGQIVGVEPAPLGDHVIDVARRPGGGRGPHGRHVEDHSAADCLPPAVLPQHVPVPGHQRHGHGQPQAHAAPLARSQRPGSEHAEADPMLAAVPNVASTSAPTSSGPVRMLPASNSIRRCRTRGISSS